MTLPTIFCPKSHLILDAPACPECGWKRPPVGGQAGSLAWQARLPAGFGGSGRHVFYQPAVAAGTLILPLQDGRLAGLSLLDGTLQWETALPPGLMTRNLVADGERVLASLSDERSFTEARGGQLAALTPGSGALESLWQAESALLSPPALAGGQVILRTSAPELISLRGTDPLRAAWRARLRSSGMLLAPAIGRGALAAHDGDPVRGAGFLLFFDPASGQALGKFPTQTLLSKPLAAMDDLLFFLDGKNNAQLNALDIPGQKLLWSQTLTRVYTPPVCARDLVLLVARGQQPEGECGYYRLLALAAADGQTVWEAPLKERALIPPLAGDDSLYLASESGLVLCLDLENGQTRWSCDLTPEEDQDRDPLRSLPLLQDGLLLVGSYSGRVAAIHTVTPEPVVESPRAYLERGEFENAAIAHALGGDLRQAAKLYAQRLKKPMEALALYCKAGDFGPAADLARSQGMLEEADELYGQGNDFKNQAEVRLGRGDPFGAAESLEKAAEWDRAGELYEQVKEYKRAVEQYHRSGNFQAILRLSQAGYVDSDIKVIEHFETERKYLEAAEECLRQGLPERAYRNFEEAGEKERALEALWETASAEPQKTWIWEKITELARPLGKFIYEAAAYEALDRVSATAEAYYRAALQAEQRAPTDAEAICRLYEKAQIFFNDAGIKQEARECFLNAARYKRQPIIAMFGKTSKEFKETNWNTLQLMVRNEGFGRARNIRWNVITDLFEMKYTKPASQAIDVLKQGDETEIEISIKPLQHGEEVPFILEWFWCEDRGDALHHDQIDLKVPVKEKAEQQITGQPIYIQGGQLIQAEKYVAGDDLAPGAQKGDKVEISRDGRVRVSIDDDQIELGGRASRAAPTCPVCGIPLEPDAKVCDHCGNPLPRKGGRRK